MFTQGRHAYDERAEPVEEVSGKSVTAHELFYVFVRRGNDAHIHSSGPGHTEPLDFAGFYRP